MANYPESITRELIRVLDHAAELHPPRVAGYAANLDFWVSECAHRLQVIDSYQERFDRMREAVRSYERDPMDWRHFGDDLRQPSRLTTRSLKSSDKKALRKALLRSVERFLSKCQRLNLVDPGTLERHCATLGIEARVFHSVPWRPSQARPGAISR